RVAVTDEGPRQPTVDGVVARRGVARTEGVRRRATCVTHAAHAVERRALLAIRGVPRPLVVQRVARGSAIDVAAVRRPATSGRSRRARSAPDRNRSGVDRDALRPRWWAWRDRRARHRAGRLFGSRVPGLWRAWDRPVWNGPDDVHHGHSGRRIWTGP